LIFIQTAQRYPVTVCNDLKHYCKCYRMGGWGGCWCFDICHSSSY